jgi:hypothetical protein
MGIFARCVSQNRPWRKTLVCSPIHSMRSTVPSDCSRTPCTPFHGPRQKNHPSRATNSLFAKRPGTEACLDRIVVFKLSNNSKAEQIFACLNSDHSSGMAKQDFFRFRNESRNDNVDSYFGVYRWAITGYDKKAP